MIGMRSSMADWRSDQPSGTIRSAPLRGAIVVTNTRNHASTTPLREGSYLRKTPYLNAIPFIALVLSFCALALPARAQVDDVDAMAGWPVLEGGRIMPMDSYARLKLLQYSGRTTYEDWSAMQWLARVVFTPEAVQGDAIFMVNNPEVVEAIGIDPGDRRRFSYAELHPGLATLFELARNAFETPETEREPVDKELLRVYHNLDDFTRLLQAFRFVAPHRDFTVQVEANRQKLALDGEGPATFLDIYLRAPGFAPEIDRISKLEPETWTDEEQELFGLSSALFRWSQMHRELPIAFLPMLGHDEEMWLSPWDLLAMRLGVDLYRGELQAMKQLAAAYRNGAQLAFDQAARQIERSLVSRAAPSRGIDNLGLELRYNRTQLFYRAEVLYGFAFLLSLIAILVGNRWVRYGAVVLIAAALLPHTVGIVWRMIIMGRPPMTNLYSTFLFVSWMCVVLGLIVEWMQKNALGSVLASFCGLSLLMFSARYVLSGDSLGVVVAVLDSNFWLSTHVVTITIGYAGCMAAGIAGHIYLLQALRKPPEDRALRGSARAVYGLLAFGLIFSFLGTMLGGVWADQSWGRFWGWDPKENGALLIVLWCAILFHARICNWINDRGMAAGSVIGVVVVLIAWLGINLLGVGLHSYGFTTGLARALWISIGFETLFLLATVPFAKRSRFLG